MNEQPDEEIYRARYGEKAGSFHALSERVTLPKLETLRTPSVRVFMEASLHSRDCLNHWPLVI